MVFLLVRENGLKHKEVAELMDISIKTVEAQIGKAMAILKKEIKPYLNELDVPVNMTKVK